MAANALQIRNDGRLAKTDTPPTKKGCVKDSRVSCTEAVTARMREDLLRRLRERFCDDEPAEEAAGTGGRPSSCDGSANRAPMLTAQAVEGLVLEIDTALISGPDDSTQTCPS
jgi:hypothetical protein